MKWFNKMERKLGRYAISNLMFYLIILYIAGFLLEWTKEGFYDQYLALSAPAILKGEVWRIFTFLLQPPTYDIFIIFAIMLYYMIGQSLEAAWGKFRFNLYIFTGILFHVAASLIIYGIFELDLPLSTAYLNLSLFFAYATIYPNQEFLVFYIIPIKVKYLALINAVYFTYAILQAFLPAYGGDLLWGHIYKANALAAVVSILNFLIFFFMSRNWKHYSAKEMKRKRDYRSKVKKARKETLYENGARHRCAVCGRTELDDPNLEFRYCSKCNGNYEYCQDHLFTHEHVK